MSKSKLQFGLRGLFVLVLAVACFLGGWTTHTSSLQSQIDRLQKIQLKISDDCLQRVEWEKAAAKRNNEWHFEVRGNLEKENAVLKEQIKVLEQMVETLNAEIEEINAVMDRPQPDKSS